MTETTNPRSPLIREERLPASEASVKELQRRFREGVLMALDSRALYLGEILYWLRKKTSRKGGGLGVYGVELKRFGIPESTARGYIEKWEEETGRLMEPGAGLKLVEQKRTKDQQAAFEAEMRLQELRKAVKKIREIEMEEVMDIPEGKKLLLKDEKARKKYDKKFRFWLSELEHNRDAFAEIAANLTRVLEGFGIALAFTVEEEPKVDPAKWASSYIHSGIDLSKLRELSFYVLHCPENATQAEIKTAYSKRVKDAHPDTGGNPYEFRIVQLAYSILKEKK
jgi:hypothetical protein